MVKICAGPRRGGRRPRRVGRRGGRVVEEVAARNAEVAGERRAQALHVPADLVDELEADLAVGRLEFANLCMQK